MKVVREKKKDEARQAGQDQTGQDRKKEKKKAK